MVVQTPGAEARTPVPAPEVAVIADPAPLGLAAFALTTFLLSVANAGWAPGDAWVGYAFFYGGLIQLAAGMWEFRNRNVFGATAFSTYGGFWLGLGFFALVAAPKILAGPKPTNFFDDLGWILVAFAIFNTYMLMWSSRVSVAVFAVFLTLEVTEIVLFIGYFVHPAATGFTIVNLGALVGILTALTAWYASAAGVVNGLAKRVVLPVGAPLWT